MRLSSKSEEVDRRKGRKKRGWRARREKKRWEDEKERKERVVSASWPRLRESARFFCTDILFCFSSDP